MVWTNPDGDCGDPLAWGRIAGGDIYLCHGEVCRLLSRNPYAAGCWDSL